MPSSDIMFRCVFVCRQCTENYVTKLLNNFIVYMDAICALKFSAVMPNSFMTISPGALNPNLSTPITLEAYLYHMADTPASMAILFVQAAGSTDSLYSAVWRSYSSMHGILTTRAPGRVLADSSACWTSDPVAMMVISRAPSSFLAT